MCELNSSFEIALEEAKWEAEFGENRLEALLNESNLADHTQGAGFTVWIQRASADGLLCHFATMEEGFTFGHAFLRTHTSDLRAELFGSKTYVEWRDNKGALWAADYSKIDSLNMIRSRGGGLIGFGKDISVGLCTGKTIPSNAWSNMASAYIVPAGLAMGLGTHKSLNPIGIIPTPDARIHRYMLPWTASWS
jgi:hypothetical protein